MRYLRWLAAQPSTSYFRSSPWRDFWRSYRRRVNAFCGLKLVEWLCYGLALGMIVAVGGACLLIVSWLPMVFLAPPEHHAFQNETQRAAVVLTRLATYQTAALSLTVIYCLIRSHASRGIERREFFSRRKDIQPLSRSIFIAGLFFGFGSAIVLIAVNFRQTNHLLPIVASLLVAGCLSYFSVGLCRRAIALRTPRLAPQLAASLLVSGIVVLPLPLVSILYGPAVLTLSQHLNWIGPFGHLNSLLLELGNGQLDGLVPLGMICLVTTVCGYGLHRSAGSWAVRRRLLAMGQAIEVDREKRHRGASRAPTVARDLRVVLSGREWQSWRTVAYPRWMRGDLGKRLFLGSALLLMQSLLIAMGVFLERLEMTSSVSVPSEKQLIFALASSIAGWSVILMEVMAFCDHEGSRVMTFPIRPVSLVEAWIDLQRRGLALLPTQILYALPFVLILAPFSQDSLLDAIAIVGRTLLACVAIRTLLVAGSYYTFSLSHLRRWFREPLQFSGLLAMAVIASGAVGLAVAFDSEVSFRSGVLRALVPQVLSAVAFFVALLVWHATSKPILLGRRVFQRRLHDAR